MENVITIVSGLPRSGTSLMMKMLEAGGMSVVMDGVREADVDNPKGYYEYEPAKTIKQDKSWLPGTRGKVFKMVSMLLVELPPDFRYKVIFMRRNIDEVLASQRKMLQRLNKRVADEDKMRELYAKHLTQIDSWLAGQGNVESMTVLFNNLFQNPQTEIEQITEFLGGRLDAGKMREVIDVTLYRNRAESQNS
ncbi:MAG: sulfotransferase domain-containing protein [Deltaproteobacteria bacterium]|nr:sulfotransferase domain-containing protein [Deltaproteobacteria bacterium]